LGRSKKNAHERWSQKRAKDPWEEEFNYGRPFSAETSKKFFRKKGERGDLPPFKRGVRK